MRLPKIKIILILLTLAFLRISAEAKITSPKEQFGFNIGDDYQLVNYTQLLTYWKKLDRESNRMQLVEIGMTAEGRPMVMAIITAPRNQARLGRHKEISRRLALARDLEETEARRLAAEGRTVVWIDGGLHATEILGSQQLIELVYQMASSNDPETLRILNDVILLAVPSNPDGLELVANWYMRVNDPTKRSMNGLPSLYHKYIGHDNNRDFYMVTQPETEAINRLLYREWYPQILYNHHQTGPAGTVLFASPFRDPFNYFFDPLIPVGIDLVGASIHSRFVAEGKPGATMRSGARYSTWWNGGLRSTGYFHNIIGILTETIGNPTPIEIPFLPAKILPKGDLPFPIAPQKWHFRQSIEYSISSDKAILDVASKHREDFLWRRYLMGKNAIERGLRDHWTIQPSQIAAVEAQIKKDKVKPTGSWFSQSYPLKYYEMLFESSKRDPRGYIIPSDQPDFLTAVKFLNTLIKNGVTVHQAAQSFEVNGKTYPQGSYIVKTAQAFRPHILSMFEPQDHPHDFAYPGGSPIPPYDSAGWTLAFQTGIAFDRILEPFDGPFMEVSDIIKPPSGTISPINADPAGFLLSHQVNDAFVVINRLLAGGDEVFWLREPFTANEKTYPPGTIYIPADPDIIPLLEKAAVQIGLNFEATASRPSGEAFRLRPVRIGLWDVYGGSMASGWIRWLLERFEFPFEVVYASELDAGRIIDKFDVLIFVSGAIPPLTPEEDGQSERLFREPPQPKPESIPEEYRKRLGKISVHKTVPQLRRFLDDGGTILAIGRSTSLAYHLHLPIADFLVEKTPDGKEIPLSLEKLYVPGSILQVKVDTTHPLADGLPENVDVFFNRSPVFALLPEASLQGVTPIAWFEDKKLLRSGWAWGEQYLRWGVEVVAADVGRGKLFLFGPEITFRGQPHGTFKFLFNGIFCGSLTSVTLD
ncbi:MAG: M14 metallopeptidase family protein [Candidatus Aminicenantales bacterium]